MKFHVTPELATLIKTVRGQNKISAKDLASHVGKSPSYISKLEAGSVKTIQKEDLTEILSFITEGEDFYEDKLPNLIRVLSSYMDQHRLMEQVWLLQYDTMDRPVRVEGDCSKDLAERLSALPLTASELTEFINANVDSAVSKSLPANEILSVDLDGNSMFTMRIQIRESLVEDLMEGHAVTTHFGLLYAVVFNTTRIEKLGTKRTVVPEMQAREVLSATTAYLSQYNIHSLSGYGHIIASTDWQDQQLMSLGDLNVSEAGVASSIVESFKRAMEHDALSTQEALQSFSQSLEWDPAFMIKLISFPFAKLDGMSFHYKKEVLEKLLAILDEYAAMPDSERNMETY